jgi:hypothetical protein
MTSGGKRYPAKADLGAGQRQGCWRDLIAPVSSVTQARTTNATVLLNTVEAQVDHASDLGFFVAGTGFEPVTSGL